jgi:hypothetical protein
MAKYLPYATFEFGGEAAGPWLRIRLKRMGRKEGALSLR